MIDDLDQYINVAKIIWPVVAWVAMVNHRLKKLEKDVDFVFWKMRGGKDGGLRKRSINSRVKRFNYDIRKKLKWNQSS